MDNKDEIINTLTEFTYKLIELDNIKDKRRNLTDRIRAIAIAMVLFIFFLGYWFA